MAQPGSRGARRLGRERRQEPVRARGQHRPLQRAGGDPGGGRRIRPRRHPRQRRDLAADHLHGSAARGAAPRGAHHAAHQAAGDQARVLQLGALGRRGRRGGGQGRAPRGGGVHARPQALPQARRPGSEGHPAPRPAGHRQDAAGQGGGQRVQRHLLRPVGGLVRGDVRGPRRRTHPAAVPPGAQGGPGDHLHRRARRRGGHPRQGHLRREGPDAEPAAGGARRLRRPRRRGGDRGLQHAGASRSGAAAPGPLRPPDPGHPARPQGPQGDPRRAHRGQAAGRRRGPGADRPPDERAERRRAGQHLQRGRDLRRAQPPRLAR